MIGVDLSKLFSSLNFSKKPLFESSRNLKRNSEINKKTERLMLVKRSSEIEAMKNHIDLTYKVRNEFQRSCYKFSESE